MTTKQQCTPASSRRWRVLAWLAIPVVLLAVLATYASTILDWVVGDDYVTHVAEGDGWVAFVRVVDYRFIPDRDSSVFLARSPDDRSTWHHLGPADGVQVIKWTGPRQLRISTPGRAPGADRLTQVEDVTIDWAH